MGATIAGRAWRISTIMNNPLNTFGKSLKDVPRIERTRQFMLHVLTLLSGTGMLRCIKGANVRGGGGGTRQSPLRVTITFGQMMSTILILIIPINVQYFKLYFEIVQQLMSNLIRRQ